MPQNKRTASDAGLKISKTPATKRSNVLKLKRPSFPRTTVVGLPVNQDPNLGHVEDRRHLAHWDEQIRPAIEKTCAKLKQSIDNQNERIKLLQRQLSDRGFTNLPDDETGLWERAAKELNGVTSNLISDRADINKAIEKCRGDIRKYREAIISKALSSRPNDLTESKELAKSHFKNPGGTPIKDRRKEINEQIFDFLNGCVSQEGIHNLLNDLQFSVTFDLSEKAFREKTEKSLLWLRKMQCIEHMTYSDALDALFSLLDK